MIKDPHDRLFKRTFVHLDNIEGELRAILPPELMRHLDFSTLKLVSGSFVDEEFS